MGFEELRRAALAVLAVFAAHTFAVLLTEPLDAAPRRGGMRLAQERGSLAEAAPARLARGGGADLTAYHGLGSWVDLFDRGPWRDPKGAVRRMDRRGVRTIYLQTATYGSPRHIVYPDEVSEFIEQAHRRNMHVVAWSVPSFTKWRKDLARAKAALSFKTPNGHRFDSFGLDIEAAIIKNISTRNKRLMKISTRLRKAAGRGYPLGAIIPDVHSRYWPRFPYKAVARVYDVMVPMGYFTFRTRSYRGVRDYTESNIRVIRKEAGPKTPIHVIGGIADDVGVPAARGFIKAVRKNGVLGASLYDFPITSKATWKELSSVPGPKPPKAPAVDGRKSQKGRAGTGSGGTERLEGPAKRITRPSR